MTAKLKRIIYIGILLAFGFGTFFLIDYLEKTNICNIQKKIGKPIILFGTNRTNYEKCITDDGIKFYKRIDIIGIEGEKVIKFYDKYGKFIGKLESRGGGVGQKENQTLTGTILKGTCERFDSITGCGD